MNSSDAGARASQPARADSQRAGDHARCSGNNPAVVESCRAMIERQIKQMVRLIDDLLDMARISRGTIQLKREKVEISRIVAAAVESCRPLIDGAGHILTVNLPAEPVILYADPDPAHPGSPQPAQQRRQVHRAGGLHLADGSGRRCPGCPPGQGHGARHFRRIAREDLRDAHPYTAPRTGLRPGSGSGSPWSRRSSISTAAASKPIATDRGREASSSSACRFSEPPRTRRAGSSTNVQEPCHSTRRHRPCRRLSSNFRASRYPASIAASALCKGAGHIADRQVGEGEIVVDAAEGLRVRAGTPECSLEVAQRVSGGGRPRRRGSLD